MRLHDQVSYRGVFTVTDTMPVGPIVEPTVVALRRFLSDHWQPPDSVMVVMLLF